MKYSIFGFSQEKVCAIRKDVCTADGKTKTYKLDTTDLLILQDLADFMNRAKIIKHTIDEKTYFSITYNAIIEDLPILDVKKQALRDRVDKLCLLGVLEKKVLKNYSGTFVAYRLTDMYEKLRYSIPVEDKAKDTGYLENREGVYKTTTPCVSDYHPNNSTTINPTTKEKEIDKPISQKNNDYSAIVECWNEYNGKTLGMVLRLTDKRKQNIKKILDAHGIDQEQLMKFIKTIPYADSWLYNPTDQHKNWKPDFDWWLANTNEWFTKALEGKVHKENYGKFVEIMGGSGNVEEQEKEDKPSEEQLLQEFFSTVSLEKEAEILGYNVDLYLAFSDEKRQNWRTAYRENFLDWIKKNNE